MHEKNLEDLATISALLVRLGARATMAGNASMADSVSDISASCMTWLCLTLDVDGGEVRRLSAQLLADARAIPGEAVH